MLGGMIENIDRWECAHCGLTAVFGPGGHGERITTDLRATVDYHWAASLTRASRGVFGSRLQIVLSLGTFVKSVSFGRSHE